MATRLVQITMKAKDDNALGGFWAKALGWAVSSEGPGVTNLEPEGFDYPDPAAVCIDLIVSAEPKTVKNRVHLDLAATSPAHRAELVARLTGLGATPVDAGPGDAGRTVLADPEGNEFCVLDALYEQTGPIASVVVDCADPRAMARFWGSAMDWSVHSVTDDEAVLRSAAGVGPYLRFVRVPEPKTGWNRVHLDVRPYPGDDPQAEAARLRALGATAVDLGPDPVPWTVLADPEGNEFCLLAPS
jgi:predicted enzyme related to lactoylglutathione lyase